MTDCRSVEQVETVVNKQTEELNNGADNRIFTLAIGVIFALLFAVVVFCNESTTYNEQTAVSPVVEDVLSAEELSSVVGVYTY